MAAERAADTKSIEAKLRAAFEHWSQIVLILDNRWKFDLNFVHDGGDWPAEQEDDCAFVRVYPGYCAAEFTFHCGRVREAEIEHTVTHELAHIVNANLEQTVRNALGDAQSDLSRSVCEQAAEQFSRALVASKMYGERTAKRSRKR